jgi:proteasome lid subunit RPN8/RPN11
MEGFLVLDFTASLYKQLIEYCKNTDEEKCGLILKDHTFISCDNIAENSKDTFMIHPKNFLRYKQNLLAVFHSHPEGGNPSNEDKIACTRSNFPWLIYSYPNTFYYIVPKEETCLQYDYTDT